GGEGRGEGGTSVHGRGGSERRTVRPRNHRPSRFRSLPGCGPHDRVGKDSEAGSQSCRWYRKLGASWRAGTPGGRGQGTGAAVFRLNESAPRPVNIVAWAFDSMKRRYGFVFEVRL